MNTELDFIFRRRSVRLYQHAEVNEDCVRDILEAAMAAPSAVAKDPWEFIVVRNRAISLFRRRWRSERGVVEFPLELVPCRAADDPAQCLERHARIEAVRSALELLAQRISPTLYAVFQLRHLQQASIAEISAQLGLTPGQVRVYDHRARRKLTEILARRDWS